MRVTVVVCVLVLKLFCVLKMIQPITKYCSTLYIGMDEVLGRACTFYGCSNLILLRAQTIMLGGTSQQMTAHWSILLSQLYSRTIVSSANR